MADDNVIPTPKMLGTPEFFWDQMDVMAWLAAEASHRHAENQRAWYDAEAAFKSGGAP